MKKQLQHDFEQIDLLLDTVKKQGVDYMKTIAGRSTAATILAPQSKSSLNEKGIGGIDALQLFNERFESLMVASSGPRYLGFVTGGSTPAAIMGDWLVSVYDPNTQSVKGNGDVSAIVELETIKMFLELLELPDSFMGGFVTGATMSNFTCLGVARQWAGKQKNIDIARDGVSGSIKVLSSTPHSSSLKSLSMLGIGSSNLIVIKTMDENREAIDVIELEQQLKNLNGEPAILISSGGTVNTVDFDDMQSISKLKSKYNFWWHIDAAFGAFAACSPEYEHLLKGWEHADSITVDCHKWLNVPYDSAVFLIKQEHRHLQVETFQNSNAPYLGDPLENFSYLNFLPENSRRFRALPAWFTLKAYGKDGYREIVERGISNAKALGNKIESSDEFLLLAPVRLNTVCFTISVNKDVDKVHAFLHELTQKGKVFMTSTVYKGTLAIRAAFVNWRTTDVDINIIWNEMQTAWQATHK